MAPNRWFTFYILGPLVHDPVSKLSSTGSDDEGTRCYVQQEIQIGIEMNPRISTNGRCGMVHEPRDGAENADGKSGRIRGTCVGCQARNVSRSGQPSASGRRASTCMSLSPCSGFFASLKMTGFPVDGARRSLLAAVMEREALRQSLEVALVSGHQRKLAGYRHRSDQNVTVNVTEFAGDDGGQPRTRSRQPRSSAQRSCSSFRVSRSRSEAGISARLATASARIRAVPGAVSTSSP
jgi:hypothetical protein